MASLSRPRRQSGLSPRVRGNLGRRRDDEVNGGSIPACAGEPCISRTPGKATPVYPRVCGGTRFVDECPGLHRGSIPACAGEPVPATPPANSKRVYPRVCGGTAEAVISRSPPGGLSPRVRGNLDEYGFALRQVRSIPACAGEPVGHALVEQPDEVYPRVCGGTGAAAGLTGTPVGLSPRVRGNPHRLEVWGSVGGSIPACAGEPVSSKIIVSVAPVYPRVCGGTSTRPVWPTWRYGLSPRVRGNLRQVVGYGGVAGSIPACAGEPFRPPRRIPGRPVYPRVCGGTVKALTEIAGVWGLSPRVRGNLTTPTRSGSSSRSIPACAGEPSFKVS